MTAACNQNLIAETEQADFLDSSAIYAQKSTQAHHIPFFTIMGV